MHSLTPHGVGFARLVIIKRRIDMIVFLTAVACIAIMVAGGALVLTGLVLAITDIISD